MKRGLGGNRLLLRNTMHPASSIYKIGGVYAYNRTIGVCNSQDFFRLFVVLAAELGN